MAQFRYVPEEATHEMRYAMDKVSHRGFGEIWKAALAASPLPPPYDEGEIEQVLLKQHRAGESIKMTARAIIEYLNGREACRQWLPIQDNPPPKDGTFVLLGVIAEGYKTAIVEGWFDEGEWRDAAGNVVDPIGWLPRDVLPSLPPKDR